MTELLTPGQIGYIAGGLFALAYLIINQVMLRLIVLLGTGFYIWYYFVAAETPLWEAIQLSAVMGLANLIGLMSLLARRSKLAIPVAHRDIYDRFADLPPGDFRDLMKLADRRVLSDEERVSEEGGLPTHLTYVISGAMRVQKMGDEFQMPAGVFVGEVAYLNNTNSAASTWVKEGSEILQWDVSTLRQKAARKDRFRLALEAVLSKDLAAKVAFAVAPQSAQWRPQLSEPASVSSSMR